MYTWEISVIFYGKLILPASSCCATDPCVPEKLYVTENKLYNTHLLSNYLMSTWDISVR
jgi:hypothetical protein